MTITEKVKAIDNKIKKNKAQYNLDRKTTKIYALSSGNVIKYKIFISKKVLPEKELLEKAAIMKRFEFSPLGKELKGQTDIAKQQYQKLYDTYEFDKIMKKEKQTLENYSILDLIYNNNYNFYKYCPATKKFDNLSLKSKPSFLANVLMI